ncbi:MAG: D-alanine-D-alanine ligase [Flavobacteriales bacterium]|jgi:D-alanine-D-alanine ligase
MAKKNIAVVAGGFSGESVISLRSAKMVMDNIDRSIYEPTLIIVERHAWVAHTAEGELPINKGDFSIDLAQGKCVFDGVFMIIHGTPGEDGIMQGYFDMIGMKYTTGDVFNMSLTFNKTATNAVLADHGYKVAAHVMLRKNDHYSTHEIVSKLGLPLFVKPNQGGSSLGASRVNVKEGLHNAIDLALKADDEVIVEAFIDGRELSCSVIILNDQVTALPITEITTDNEFFDFQAKYEGKSEEITPAQVDDSLRDLVQQQSREIFELLDCKGMIRVDFLIRNELPFVVEVNTVPGFSEQSIIPQQALAMGLSIKELVSAIIQGSGL